MTVSPTTHSTPNGLYGAARLKAMTAVCLAVLLAQIDYAIANIALPDIGADLHSSASDTVWVVNAYQLASLSSLLPLAAAGAWIGYARMCMMGITLFILASVGCALAPTLPLLTIARAIQGFGAASMLGVVSALIRFIYPVEELGKGVSVNTLIVGVGMALGPTVAGMILAVAHWPWLFWINLPIGVLTFVLAASSLPVTPRQKEMPDPIGAVLCIIAVTALGLGGNSVAHSDGAMLACAMLVVGVAAMSGLIRKESSSLQPILPIDLLRGIGFRIAFIVGIIAYIGSNLFMISMPFTLHDHYGWSATATGLLMTPWAFGLIVSASVTRRVADRIPQESCPRSVLSSSCSALSHSAFCRTSPQHSMSLGGSALPGSGLVSFRFPTTGRCCCPLLPDAKGERAVWFRSPVRAARLLAVLERRSSCASCQ